MREQADKIELIRQKIEDADAIVIGAGAGLSTAAGFTYSRGGSPASPSAAWTAAGRSR